MTNEHLPFIVPLEHSGKWIAWDYDETKILSAGDSYAQTKQAAVACGELRPVLVKTPQATTRFFGGSQ